jgi:hypothetical protein
MGVRTPPLAWTGTFKKYNLLYLYRHLRHLKFRLLMSLIVTLKNPSEDISEDKKTASTLSRTYYSLSIFTYVT